jgi:hypothetical protein
MRSIASSQDDLIKKKVEEAKIFAIDITKEGTLSPPFITEKNESSYLLNINLTKIFIKLIQLI